MFLEVEEGGQDPYEKAVLGYLIRFTADLPLGYYRRFVNGFSQKTHSLTETKKISPDKVQWTDSLEAEFALLNMIYMLQTDSV